MPLPAPTQKRARGVPATKINLGMASYGRGWTNVGAANNGLYQSGTAAAGSLALASTWFDPRVVAIGETGMDIGPLWWALAFGAGFGGSGTIIGSTANIIVTTLSEKTHTPITARLWNKRGLPVMLVTLIVTTILYIVAYPFYLK